MALVVKSPSVVSFRVASSRLVSSHVVSPRLLSCLVCGIELSGQVLTDICVSTCPTDNIGSGLVFSVLF